MHPYYDPNAKPPEPKLDPTGRPMPEPELRYVTASEATPEDRVTALDKMAMLAGIGCAQFLRLLILVAAVALVFVLLYLLSHL
jgi:hypothetical protein